MSFVKDSITVSLPDGGVVVDGWKITCTTSKVVSDHGLVIECTLRQSQQHCTKSCISYMTKLHDHDPSPTCSVENRAINDRYILQDILLYPLLKIRVIGHMLYIEFGHVGNSVFVAV